MSEVMTPFLPAKRQRLPLTAYLWAIVAVIAALGTTNPLLTAASVFVLLFLGWLLWRPGEPPVLLFAAGYQWSQVTTLVFLGDYESKPVALLSYSPKVEQAIWLGLVGLIVLATGMRYGVRRLGNIYPAVLDPELHTFSVDRVFALYAVFAVIAGVVPYLVWRLLPIAQILYAIASLKWVFYMLLGYATLRRRTKRAYFAVATLVEFVVGIGYFSGFKTVFFFCGLLLLSIHWRVNLRTILVTVAVVAIVAVASLAWLSVRADYRAFLNQGTGQQVVLVSPVEQVQEFGSLVSEVGPEDLQGSVTNLFRRLAYVDYFGAALAYVPAQRPHEEGRLLWAAIRHLIPRFLDPDKPILGSDSEVTMRYTGLSVAGADQGTSIGLGYMVEAYIDFGIYGMFVVVLLLGVIWGKMYTWLVLHSRMRTIGLALGTALIIDASAFEVAEAKLIGGMVAKFLVYVILLKYLMPPLRRWMSSRAAGVGAPLGLSTSTMANAPTLGISGH